MDTLLDTLKRLGDLRDLARSLGLKPSAPRNWIYQNYVPAKHHARIIKLAKDRGIALETRDLDPYDQAS